MTILQAVTEPTIYSTIIFPLIKYILGLFVIIILSFIAYWVKRNEKTIDKISSTQDSIVKDLGEVRIDVVKLKEFESNQKIKCSECSINQAYKLSVLNNKFDEKFKVTDKEIEYIWKELKK